MNFVKLLVTGLKHIAKYAGLWPWHRKKGSHHNDMEKLISLLWTYSHWFWDLLIGR